MHPPQTLKVLLDGVDLRSLNVCWLRSQLGLVGQVRERLHGQQVW